MLLEQVGREGQYSLISSRVLVVGAGGLAATVLPYLVGAGVGFIRVIDNDLVDESNLHRQVLFRVADIGKPKALCAKQTVEQLNPTVVIEAICERFGYDNCEALSAGVDVVVDCTDNMDSRYCMSDVCVVRGLHFVTGSAIAVEGQVSVLCGPKAKDKDKDSDNKRAPCYRCLHPTPSRVEGCRSCSASGVLGPIPGLIGCLEALETIKLCLSLHSEGADSEGAALGGRHQHQPLRSLVGRQLYYDGIMAESEVFDVSQRRNPTCVVCGDRVGGATESSAPVSIAECQRIYVAQNAVSVNSVGQQSVLPAEPLRLSALAYYQQMSHSSHILIDVRVVKQFSLLSLLHYFQEGYGYCRAPTTDQASLLFPERKFVLCTLPLTYGGFSFKYAVYHIQWSSGSGCDATSSIYMVNIPLADLQLSPNAKHAACARVSALLECITALRNKSYRLNDSVMSGNDCSGEQLPVYVLCRRGVDSVTATQLLTTQLHSLDPKQEKGGVDGAGVYNVEGGLNAWRADVDPYLPEY